MLTSQRHRILIAAADVIFVGDILCSNAERIDAVCILILGFTSLHPIVVSAIAARRENPSSAFGTTKGERLMLSIPPAI